jgi:hypothetical protein
MLVHNLKLGAQLLSSTVHDAPTDAWTLVHSTLSITCVHYAVSMQKQRSLHTEQL